MPQFRLLLSASIVLTVAGLARCSFPSPVGEDIVRNEMLDVVFVDTITLRLSTVHIDSFVTSNTDRHLVGYREDTELGRIAAQPYFRISNDSLTLPNENAEYLSAEFELFYDGYFYYDTTQDMTLSLHPLTEELEPDEDDKVLYNFSRFAYAVDAPVGRRTFAPRPGRSDPVLIRVDDTFGQTLFDFADPEESEVFYDEFEERYFGFTLVPDTTRTQSFVGFAVRSRLVIHYRDEGEEKELIFPTSQLRFNQITNDRRGTPLASLITREEELSSTVTDHRAYLSNGAGTALKVEMPSLAAIGEELTQNFITEATLVLRPIRDTYDDLTPFPSEIDVYVADRFNRRRRALPVGQSLVVDDEFGEDTEYRIDLTDFIQEEIEETARTEDAILLRGSDSTLATTVDRLVVGDSFHEFEATLELLVLDYIIDNE